MWPEVGDPLRWSTYWAGLEKVRALSGPTPGPGSAYELVFKSFLPYTLELKARIDEYEEPRRIVMSTEGELEGRAEFSVNEVPGGTRTQLIWVVHTTKPWMNVLAFAFRDLFAWNHDVLMRSGGRGLADRIGAGVTQAEGTAPSLPRALLPFALFGLGVAILVRRQADG